MNLARLVLELRRRAGGNLQTAGAVDLNEVLAELRKVARRPGNREAAFIREFVREIVGIKRAGQWDGSMLDSLSSETMFRLNLVLDALMTGTLRSEELHAALVEVLMNRQ